ncbi:UDP binding domain-containing protein [Brachybacterium sp. AG952]|uniref:UDP binding domain-containing protein n=1 Tax=Brachybacterium sp. AG952 TaxID=2183989 RepID=UPI001FB6CFE7|nr:UDP binding domain-containing protein [Brachybacterium sp. AG952]
MPPPKDIRGLISRAGELGTVDSFAFLRDIDAINQGRREYEVRLAKRLLDEAVDDKRIAVLGAAFKPYTDDVRDSPFLVIALKLCSEGARVIITDPVAKENLRRRYPSFHVEDSTDETLRDADLVLLLTKWKQYRDLDPRAAKELVSTALKRTGFRSESQQGESERAQEVQSRAA